MNANTREWGNETPACGTNNNTYLYLGYSPGLSSTYSLSAGLFSGFTEYLGYSGTGTFTQTGGTNSSNSNSVYLGYNSGSSGTYSISNGQLTAWQEYVGYDGTGSISPNRRHQCCGRHPSLCGL